MAADDSRVSRPLRSVSKRSLKPIASQPIVASVLFLSQLTTRWRLFVAAQRGYDHEFSRPRFEECPHFSGLGPGEVRIRHLGADELHEVRADSYLAENTIERPDTVTLAKPQTLRLAQTGTMTYRLKPNSLVVLRFERARVE